MKIEPLPEPQIDATTLALLKELQDGVWSASGVSVNCDNRYLVSVKSGEIYFTQIPDEKFFA